MYEWAGKRLHSSMATETGFNELDPTIDVLIETLLTRIRNWLQLTDEADSLTFLNCCGTQLNANLTRRNVLKTRDPLTSSCPVLLIIVLTERGWFIPLSPTHFQVRGINTNGIEEVIMSIKIDKTGRSHIELKWWNNINEKGEKKLVT